MKIRNKKTGKVITSEELLTDEFITDLFSRGFDYFNSKLHKIQDEWEEYEEPKDRWYINENGGVLRYVPYDPEGEDLVYNKYQDEIGNHFETKEEAEKAVEKLKAFTNLMEHEFAFDGWYYGTNGDIVILANAHEFNDMEEQDLTKVFGGKIC